MTTFHFDDLSLDTARRTLSRGDQSIDIGGLSYDLLSTLVEAAPNAVDQTELAEAVWHNRVVTPETLSQRVRLVRSALGDDADAPRYIPADVGEWAASRPDQCACPHQGLSSHRGCFDSAI